MYNIDELKRKLIDTGMHIDCVDKAIGLVADYASNAYTQGYDNGYEAGYRKGLKIESIGDATEIEGEVK